MTNEDASGQATRESIIRLLERQRDKFEVAYTHHIRRTIGKTDDERAAHDAKTIRLDAKISEYRTIIAYIARGVDLQGQ